MISYAEEFERRLRAKKDLVLDDPSDKNFFFRVAKFIYPEILQCAVEIIESQGGIIYGRIPNMLMEADQELHMNGVVIRKSNLLHRGNLKTFIYGGPFKRDFEADLSTQHDIKSTTLTEGIERYIANSFDTIIVDNKRGGHLLRSQVFYKDDDGLSKFIHNNIGEIGADRGDTVFYTTF